MIDLMWLRKQDNAFWHTMTAIIELADILLPEGMSRQLTVPKNPKHITVQSSAAARPSCIYISGSYDGNMT